MVSTEIVVDAIFQIQIKLPLEVTREEALELMRKHYHEILRGVTIHRPTLSNLFQVPYCFVDARGLIDDIKLDDIRVTTWKEDRT